MQSYIYWIPAVAIICVAAYVSDCGTAIDEDKEPKFFYGQEVVINFGFYKGWVGFVSDFSGPNIYEVQLLHGIAYQPWESPVSKRTPAPLLKNVPERDITEFAEARNKEYQAAVRERAAATRDK
jgi:hypothetical protein